MGIGIGSEVRDVTSGGSAAPIGGSEAGVGKCKWHDVTRDSAGPSRSSEKRKRTDDEEGEEAVMEKEGDKENDKEEEEEVYEGKGKGKARETKRRRGGK